MVRTLLESILFDMYVAFLTGSVLINLALAIVGRIVFVTSYLVNYFTFNRKKSLDSGQAIEEWRNNGKDWAWFAGKEAIFAGIGMLHLVLAIAVVGYSLINGGSHLIATSKRSNFKGVVVIGTITGGFFKYAIPFLALAATSYMTITGTDKNAPQYIVIISLLIAVFSARYAIGARLRSRGRVSRTIEAVLRQAKHELADKVPIALKAAMVTTIVLAPFIGYMMVDAYVAVDYKTEYLAMDDGTLLATDVYRQRGDTIPRPVILLRTPYNKGNLATNKGVLDLVKAGYAVVYQDMRGRYQSEGKFIPFIDDRFDGAKTVAWIKNQSWCNGNIASTGASAGTVNQYCYADEPSGALKFQTLSIGAPELYDHMIFQGGAFRKAMLESWVYTIWKDNSPGRATEYSDAIDWIVSHQVKDASWNTTSLSMGHRYASVNVSAIHFGGWYDICSQGTIDGFIGYNYHGGPGALGKQRLVMGPYGHGKFGVLTPVFNATSLAFPRADESRHAGWENEMRSAALAGTPVNWSEPCVAYYLMGDVNQPSSVTGANKWYYASGWPANDSTRVLYVASNGSLIDSNPAGNANVSCLYDPRYPVLTKGGNNLMADYASLELDALGFNNWDGDKHPDRVEQFVGTGPYDQAAARNLARSDVLVFESAPLPFPLSVVGNVRASLWVASNCTDTAFTVMLMDRYQNGSCYNILDGILVMRSRDGYNITAPDMIGGQAYEISVDLWSTAYQFNTGHRITIAISSSNYPRFERHPNHSGAFTNHPSSFNVANNSVLTGGMYPSCIVLPVVS